jgi:hypothetical protein
MESLPRNVVYHGSPRPFGTVEPKLNKRVRIEQGEPVVIFNEVSFHATPHRWIALAYTYDGRQTFELNGKEMSYSMGVDLYGTDKVVTVLGTGSLEESLSKLYGKGGYLYHYDASHFFYTEGLGNREVITKDSIDPIEAEHITHPVEEMKKEGVEFHFIDLALPENARYLD